MNEKPINLEQEIALARKPRVNVALPSRQNLPDDTIDQHSRQLGEKWGSATRIPERVAPPPVEPRAPTRSFRFHCPDYLDTALAMKAAEMRVTKSYLILESLKKAGYPLKDTDLAEDWRRDRPTKR